MRLFTGLEIPEDICNTLANLVDQLRPLAPLRWSPVDNFHITTKFIGDFPEPRLPELKAALDSLPSFPHIPISLPGLGWIPNPHHPRILLAAVHAPPTLADFSIQSQSALAAVGVPVEQRDYRPHLTLARIGERGAPVPDLTSLRQAIARLPQQGYGAFVATQFFLYLSEPTGRGSRYTKLARFPLEKP
jgi:2'-5' RNA ligase